MKISKILEDSNFTLVNNGDLEREVGRIYCCDLLSIVMSRAPVNAAWVTVMGNMNAVAVATLSEMSCIILAEGISADENMINKAKQEHINIIATELPIYETAVLIKEMLYE